MMLVHDVQTVAVRVAVDAAAVAIVGNSAHRVGDRLPAAEERWVRPVPDRHRQSSIAMMWMRSKHRSLVVSYWEWEI